MVFRTIRMFSMCVLLGLAAANASSQDKPKADAPKAETPKADSSMDDKQKTSYAVGTQFGHAIADGAAFIDIDALIQGCKDAMNKQDSKVTEEEMGPLLQKLQQQIMENRYASNKNEGETFLADNGKKEGVKTLPSGLQYKVITEGSGKSPKATDTVSTNYRGTFINGTEFDSSYKRNQPAEFPVNRVIPGWTEALQLMKEGGKWQIWVPYALAYGEEGRPPQIPPFSALVFEVELLKVVDTPPPAAGGQSVTIKPQAQPKAGQPQ